MTKQRIVLEQHHWKDGDLDVIRWMMDQSNWEQAEKTLRYYLNDNPDDFRAQFLLGRLYISTDRYAEGRLCYQYLRDRFPERIDVALNLAKAHDYLLDWETSAALYHEILEKDPGNVKAMTHLGAIAVQLHKPQEAIEWCDKALTIEPGATQPLSNKAFAYLQMRDFANGWKYYEHGAGHLRWRQVYQYAGEPRWRGEKGKDVKLIIYSEQGIGDQIAGIEPLREAMRDCDVIGLDTDPKMRKLFRRAFPEIPFHGREDINKAIERGDIAPTHSGGIFSLHTHYRRSESDYPKRPYLTADPGLRAMYRGWLDSLGGGLKIGLSLSGGHSLTHKTARNLPLDALLPILRTRNTFVSLEYRDRGSDFDDFCARKGIRIHTNPHIVANLDFDDPAALIAELDVVIGVPGTAMHACGALGTSAICLVHKTPNAHYCNEGELMPYYGSVRMIRREQDDRWVESVEQAKAWLDDMQTVEEAA